MKKFGIVLLAICICFAATVSYVKVTERYYELKGHGEVRAENQTFTESAQILRNPARGFYHMYGFRILDEETDFRESVAKRFCYDTNTKLAMIEINLEGYRDRPISEQGLENLEALFTTLEKLDKQLIIRFLYDWDGKNEELEPESLDIILGHIGQVEPMLRKHSAQIFTLQGLFIGNWGEMNGTKYLEDSDFQALADKLASVTEKSTFLAVRMPAQWRRTTGIGEPEKVIRGDGSLPARLGLFNDGMLGSWSDYGTYGDKTKEKHGYFTFWNREEELAFQDVLCSKVPIGGEVIVDNSYNDFDNAVKDLSAMHVTYIGRDYDTKVLDKWAAATVEEAGCFDGMDGLSYIERHLGYRLVFDESFFAYDEKADSITAGVTVRNVGFAPVYRETRAHMILVDDETEVCTAYAVEQDIRELSGGKQSGKTLNLKTKIHLFGQKPGTYSVYFVVKDKLTGEKILFANEEEPGEYGYYLGKIVLDEAVMPWEKYLEGDYHVSD